MKIKPKEREKMVKFKFLNFHTLLSKKKFIRLNLMQQTYLPTCFALEFYYFLVMQGLLKESSLFSSCRKGALHWYLVKKIVVVQNSSKKKQGMQEGLLHKAEVFSAPSIRAQANPKLQTLSDSNTKVLFIYRCSKIGKKKCGQSFVYTKQ